MSQTLKLVTERTPVDTSSDNDYNSLAEILKQYGDGGGGNGMEARVAKLESDVEYIKRDVSEMKTELQKVRDNARSDFRLLISSIGASFVILLGVMAWGFGSILSKMP